PAAASAELQLPAVVTLRFPDLVLPVELSRGNGRGVLATFLPPWRLASPLPPDVEGGKKGEKVLTVTSEAAPGDRAFELPLGRGFADPRARLRISKGAAGEDVFEGAPAPPKGEPFEGALPPGTKLVEEPQRFRAQALT